MSKNKQKKKVFVPVVIILLIGLVSFIFYKAYNPPGRYSGTPLEPIEKLVRVQHFDEGKYEDYKSLFTKPESALEKEKFEVFRSSNTAGDVFKYGSNNVETVMSHMKSVQDGNFYYVYYLKDVNDNNEIKKSSYWKVTKKNGKWMIDNG